MAREAVLAGSLVEGEQDPAFQLHPRVTDGVVLDPFVGELTVVERPHRQVGVAVGQSRSCEEMTGLDLPIDGPGARIGEVPVFDCEGLRLPAGFADGDQGAHRGQRIDSGQIVCVPAGKDRD